MEQFRLNKVMPEILNMLVDENFELIYTHPPYENIIQYSKDIENDLSHLKVSNFLEERKKVANESYRVLKKANSVLFLWEIQDKKDT